MGHFWAGLYRGGHVMLLRDPVERAVSNFFHFVQSAERGIGTNLLMEAVGRGVVSLDDWALGRGPGDEIWPGYPEERPWNMMGRWIAGIPDPERWRDGSLWAEVVSGLGRFDAIATDPQKLFEFMGFEGEVRRVNANPGNPGPGVLSRAARSELVVRNMVDYRLFDMVNEAGGLLCSPF